MYKPDWKDAPEWAQYLAMDPDGSWWWYASKPRVTKYGWESRGLCDKAGNTVAWDGSLQERPEPGDEDEGDDVEDCTACAGSGRYDAEGSPPCGACGGSGTQRRARS